MRSSYKRSLPVVFVILILSVAFSAQSAPDKAYDNSGTPNPEIVPTVRTKGVTAPRPISVIDPQVTKEARRAKVHGEVSLRLVASSSGEATNIRVVQGLGYGLDEKAVEAVRKWKFKPATKDGAPVAVEITVLMDFRKY